MGVNCLPKTVTRQRGGCDLNPGPSAPESSTLTTRLPSHPGTVQSQKTFASHKKLCYRRRTARRVVSQNLVNCRNKLYNKFTTKPSNGVGRLQLTDLRSIGVVIKLDRRRRRRVLLTTRSTCLAKFSKSGVWNKVPERSTLIVGDAQISLQYSVG